MRRVTVENNVSLRILDLNPKAASTIVFIHGWPLDHRMFEYQLNVLPNFGIRCVCPDLRGFGCSDRPWHGYSYNRLADDLYAVITALNLRRFTLLGFSMGGAIAVRYMARHGGYGVKRLVLCGAACPSFVRRPGYPYGMTVEQVTELIDHLYADRPQTLEAFGEQFFSPASPSQPLADWFTRMGCDSSSWGTIQCAQSLRDEDLRDDLDKIRVPTAILHGVHDAVCPFAFAQEMHSGIAGSQLIPFEKSGHALFYEEREKFNTHLLTFAQN